MARPASRLISRFDPTRITTPTRPWEILGFRVNEGPAVIVRNGRVVDADAPEARETDEEASAADFALDARRVLRPDLRILAMSATADADRFAAVLGTGSGAPAPVV